MIELEARIVGSAESKGLGSVFLSPEQQDATAADLIRLGVDEQIRELLATRRLSASEAIRELRRQYQTAGSLSSLPDDARLDRTRETERALAAFSAGICLLFVDGEQVRDLDQRIPLAANTRVQFLRLVPLAGG